MSPAATDSSPAPGATPPPRLALIACQVLEGEIALHAAGATHIATTQFYEIGLHDRPDHLRQALQAKIGELAGRTDLDAIVLAYGLCGRGTAGLRAQQVPLVIPRAHDCITLFYGSKELYAAAQARCPDCYYYTPGWNRARRVPGPDRLAAMRADLAARFEPEDVEYLLETERSLWAKRGLAIYLELQTPDAEKEAAYARECAEHLGWAFERVAGDPRLLRDLLWGRWDEARFLVVPPGQAIAQSVDAAVMRCQP